MMSSPSIGEVARALRHGRRIEDWCFDHFLPRELQRVSGQYWTPVEVAMQVAEWLNLVGVRSVVDVGAGAGKFCVVAALSSICEFTGLEQRPHLVSSARKLAELFGVTDRVRFVRRSIGHGEIPEADAYYLYNPFWENLLGSNEQLDNEVELSAERYERDIRHTEEFLARTKAGTYVVKYNGFGGRMPAEFEPVRIDRAMPNVLRMWRKVRESR